MTKKPGRPRKHGFQPIWMLMRATTAFYAYDEARRRGEKHSAAVQSAACAVRLEYPGMPISETEVKRMLAQWRPSNQDMGLIISKPEPPNDTIILPDGKKARRVLDASFGPRPTYPRINAALKGS